MTTFAEPVLTRRGATDPEAPLVVLLHGRGSDEEQIATLAGHLPRRLAYAAVRAPIAEGGGFAWFANRGIGRPAAESLGEAMAWFREWLDAEAEGRPVAYLHEESGAALTAHLDPGGHGLSASAVTTLSDWLDGTL